MPLDFALCVLDMTWLAMNGLSQGGKSRWAAWVYSSETLAAACLHGELLPLCPPCLLLCLCMGLATGIGRERPESARSSLRFEPFGACSNGAPGLAFLSSSSIQSHACCPHYGEVLSCKYLGMVQWPHQTSCLHPVAPQDVLPGPARDACFAFHAAAVPSWRVPSYPCWTASAW